MSTLPLNAGGSPFLPVGFEGLREIENSNSELQVADESQFPAAKRRQNTAQGASPGCRCEMTQPQRGVRSVLTQTRKRWVSNKEERVPEGRQKTRQDATGSQL